MAFDLQKMLHRKGAFETARLDYFVFRALAAAERSLRDEIGDPMPVRLA